MLINRSRFLVVVVLLLWCPLFCSVLVAQPSSPAVSAEHQYGVDLYRQENYKAAANHFKSLLKKNKADAISSYYLGLSLDGQHKLKDAANAFEKALGVRPNFPLARLALSHVKLRQNKYSAALHDAQLALTIDPKMADAHYLVGLIRVRSGMPEQALAPTDEAIKLAPEMARAHLLRSIAVLDIYARKATQDLNPRVVQAKSPATLTPEERERRLQKRADSGASFLEAADSLRTYLRLQPADSSTPDWREQLETLEFYANQLRPNKDKMLAKKVLWFGEEVTTKARILSKPEPSYTDAARNSGVRGIVVLRAVFAADGTVQHILVLTGLPEGLTERAIKAARLIKFEPATVNGTPVSMAVQLEYNFNLY